MYALRSSHTGTETITCKGLPAWLTSGHTPEEKEKFASRWKQNNAKEIKYEDFINLIENNIAIVTSPIEVESN